MGGWQPATVTFLLAGAILAAGVLAVHYGRALAAWWRRQLAPADCTCQRCRTVGRAS